jgi:Histidine kinase-, DNA gyrase B-, and HSP90-like ATPase
MEHRLERLTLPLLLRAPAARLPELFRELEDYLSDVVDKKFFLLLLSAPRMYHGNHDHLYVTIPRADHGKSLAGLNRLSSLNEVKSLFPNCKIHRLDFKVLDYPNWFHFLILTENETVSTTEFSNYISPTVKNRTIYALDTIRAAIRATVVRISLRSRDLTSFLHRSINEVFLPTFNCEGVSIFYRAESSEYLTLGATTGIREMEQHGLKRPDIKYFLDSKSFTSRCYNKRELIVEDIAAKSPLHVNTLGESVSSIVNRAYIPIKIREPSTEQQPDGLMGVIRMINAHVNDSCRPLDCIDVYILTYLAELIAVLGNRYLRNISILHDQERATHGFGTDLLTIKLATELNMRHIETLNRIVSVISTRRILDKSHDAPMVDDASLRAANFALTQLHVRSKDIFSIQDHMAEQMVRVLQTSDNYIEHSDTDAQICFTPYKTIFLRLVGAKEGLVKMFNRSDLTITWNKEDRFDDELKQLPSLSITNSGMYTIVRNLAENAIKYTQETQTPHIDISWNRKERDVFFHFRDWGIGITKRDEEKLFAEGFRGLEAQRMQLRGNGIGLFLSRDIARRFKGELQYIRPSDKEGGSIFVLRVRMHGG